MRTAKEPSTPGREPRSDEASQCSPSALSSNGAKERKEFLSGRRERDAEASQALHIVCPDDGLGNSRGTVDGDALRLFESVERIGFGLTWFCFGLVSVSVWFWFLFWVWIWNWFS
jgi:hypothetical protein